MGVGRFDVYGATKTNTAETNSPTVRSVRKFIAAQISSIFDEFLVLVILNWRRATANVSPAAAAAAAVMNYR